MANRPIPFPKNDETWKDVFRLENKGCDYYPYRNEDGDILWVVYVDRTFKNKRGRRQYNKDRITERDTFLKIFGLNLRALLSPYTE